MAKIIKASGLQLVGKASLLFLIYTRPIQYAHYTDICLSYLMQAYVFYLNYSPITSCAIVTIHYRLRVTKFEVSQEWTKLLEADIIV